MGSFWRFGFAESSIDKLLSNASSPLNASVSAGDDDQAGVSTLALEQLLEEDDLLQEVKTQHAKLVSSHSLVP